ncbi:P-loop containing nucleoside triphosphate hydrolase protein [Cladochytrium replicatum]|nr:P-loop containing nucleoside triphosphate hydrolase protein [Cladochytrium replicatum]
MLDLDSQKSLPRLSVLLIGHSAVGKSDLISTFLANPYPQLQLPSRSLSRKPSFLPSSSSSIRNPSTTRRSTRRNQPQPRRHSIYTPTLEDSHSIQYTFHPSPSTSPQSPSDSTIPASQRLSLRIIDIGGAPELSSLLPSAIAASEAFVFVFDLTDRTSFEGIPALHRKVLDATSNKQHSPFVLVGNKADKEGRQVDRDSGERLASLMGAAVYFETSAYDADAVGRVFRAVVVHGMCAGHANASPALPGPKQFSSSSGISRLSRRPTLSSSNPPTSGDDSASPKRSPETPIEDDAATLRASTSSPLLLRTRSFLNLLIRKPSESSLRPRASSDTWSDTGSNASSSVTLVGAQSARFEESSSDESADEKVEDDDDDDGDEGIRAAAAEMGLGLGLQWPGAAAVLATGRA